MKVITLNKLTTKRKVKCVEIPHYAYTLPLHNITHDEYPQVGIVWVN